MKKSQPIISSKTRILLPFFRWNQHTIRDFKCLQCGCSCPLEHKLKYRTYIKGQWEWSIRWIKYTPDRTSSYLYWLCPKFDVLGGSKKSMRRDGGGVWLLSERRRVLSCVFFLPLLIHIKVSATLSTKDRWMDETKWYQLYKQYGWLCNGR